MKIKDKFLKIKNNGFSLTELIIAIVIISILAIVAVNVYRVLLFKAVSTEAKTMVGLIARAEKLYWVEYGTFYAPQGYEPTGYDDVLGVDARANNYFQTFQIMTGDETSLWVQSEIDHPYNGLVLILTIHGMSEDSDAKATMIIQKDNEFTDPIDID